jgi:AraC-like DNA-binding protein
MPLRAKLIHDAHLIRGACLTDYVELARSVGLEPHRMIAAVGLPRASLQDPDIKVSLRAFIRLLEVSTKSANIDNFGLRLSEKRVLSNLGPVGLIAREQSTVRKALEALAHYIGLHSDGINLRIEDRDDLVVLKPVVLIRQGMPIRQATELSVAVMFRILRIALGGAWKPQFVSFSHGPPRSRDIHYRIFGPRVDFGQDSNAIACRARDLEKAIPTSDPVMARYIRQYLELIGRRATATVSHKVWEFVWMLLPAGRCSIEHIAEHMGVHRRTIHRRLRQEGTTFSSIVEDVRTEMVKRYLEESSRSLSLMARMLGFSGSSAFSRWFRDRFGCSVSQWRANVSAFEDAKAPDKARS